MLNLLRKALFRKQPPAPSATEEVFTAIFDSNHWGDPESVSGAGSTLAYTRNLRKELPALFEKYGIRTIFDAPSGDFNWMSMVIDDVKLNYIGGDIVKSLVDRNNEKYANDFIRFHHFDITEQNFPKADLWICRDCLFHLPFSRIKMALERFVASGIPYVLTTTHVNTGFLNVDIPLGGFRMIDLFSSPFNFPQHTLERIEDWVPGFPPRLLCLWSREQVQQALQTR